MWDRSGQEAQFPPRFGSLRLRYSFVPLKTSGSLAALTG